MNESMTTHTHTPRPETRLADLLRIAVQQCGRSDTPPTSLPDVIKLAAMTLGRVVSEVALLQVAEAVVSANELPSVGGHDDPLTAVAAAVMSATEAPADALHALLVEAWMAHEPEVCAGAAPEPTRVEDLEMADLAHLTLAGSYYLLAHDEAGEALVPERVRGLGLAGGVLAETLLAGLIHIDPATGMLNAHTSRAAVEPISQVAEDTAGRLREPRPVRTTLQHLASEAYERVRGELLYAGILTRRESTRRLRRVPLTLFPPARPRLPDRVFNSLTALQSTDASRLELHDAALIALVRATGLASAAGRQWWMAADIPAEQAVARSPALRYLVGQVGALVTTAVAVRQR